MTKDSQKERLLRVCVSCRQSKPRQGLLRILRDHKSGAYIVEPDVKTFGRSFYLCKSESCLAGLAKNKRYKTVHDKIHKELEERI